MSWEIILILTILITTTLIYIIHTLSQNKSGKFLNFINRIWDEWFEDQWKAIIAFVLLTTISLLLGLIFQKN